jgi:hypothetical protein
METCQLCAVQLSTTGHQLSSCSPHAPQVASATRPQVQQSSSCQPGLLPAPLACSTLGGACPPEAHRQMDSAWTASGLQTYTRRVVCALSIQAVRVGILTRVDIIPALSSMLVLPAGAKGFHCLLKQYTCCLLTVQQAVHLLFADSTTSSTPAVC